MTWLVVPDDDTLRDRLAEALTQHHVGWLRLEHQDESLGQAECRCGWKSGYRAYAQASAAGINHTAESVWAVLRDVGTPATTQTDCAVDMSTHVCTHRQRTRLVTDWTEAPT